jgi:hypothetical protein
MGDLTVYNKEEPKTAGARLVDLGYALKEGGPGFDDIDEAQAFIGAFMGAINELQGDVTCAILHVAAGAAEAAGDRRLAEKLAALDTPPVE